MRLIRDRRQWQVFFLPHSEVRERAPAIIIRLTKEYRFMLGSILWAVVVILVILWLLGWLVVHVGGGLIHILLIIAVIVLLYNLFVGMRRRV
jgi:hypothetical protein